MAARAHDVAAITIKGHAAILNFPELAHLETSKMPHSKAHTLMNHIMLSCRICVGVVLEYVFSKSRGPSNRGNHHSSSSKGKFADVECYHCHKKGHTMKFCRQLKKENKKKNFNNQKNKHKKDDDGDDSTEVNTTTDEFFVCSDYDMVNLAHDDSRMLQHEKNIFHLTHQIVARGKRESKSIVNAIDNDDMTELWHKRLGHMSEKGMSILSKKNVLSGVHDINLEYVRRAFKSRPSFRMENILDLVHSDVCGPMKTKTLGGCSYFVTFIYDHSRKVWVYTLKTKDQVLDVFKQFHALVERQTGKKIKCIRSDNGDEYIGPFDVYCREHGIQHQKTPPKTP
ncbi:retrovirus-related pol polyprotein from transposon TNT 1-94, partial [Tanacetum coccineum]